jgi:chaperonin GroEL
MIAANTGFDGSVVVERVRALKGAQGFNARTEVFEDLMKAGVIDPTKVARCALENAASVSGLLLMTDAVIYEKPEKEKGMPQMPGGGMGGMGGMDY